MRTYRDLVVWQKAIVMVTEAYRITKGFPREELYGLTAQMRRCAVSIPSNVAEGYGRNSTQDYVRFLRLARGSLYELQTQLQISINLNYLVQEAFENIFALTREIERMLSSLIMKIEKNTRCASVPLSLYLLCASVPLCLCAFIIL